MRNKENYFLNKPYTKDYILKIREKLKNDPLFLSQTIKDFSAITSNFPKIFTRSINGEDSKGDLLNGCKKSDYVFDAHGVESCRYIYSGGNIHNSYDLTTTGGNDIHSWNYEGISVSQSDKCLFTKFVRSSRDVYYSDSCHFCQNCFGCIGLKNQQYCILNKQYTKEEYEKLVPKIIEHMMKPHPNPLLQGEAEIEWGEFFPSSLSPFGYNETLAQEYFPLTRSSVILSETKYPLNSDTSQKQNIDDSSLFSGGQKEKETFIQGPIFNWSDYEAPFPKVEKIISGETQNLVSLLDNANNVPDDILNWAIECEITQKPFRIIKQELEFYRKHNLPIPRRHPDQRHLDRMALRNPRKLFERKCDKCSKDIQTTYAPERPEIVYCEECYNKEVY